MKSLVEFINEGKKMSDDYKPSYNEQIELKKQLNTELGFSKKYGLKSTSFHDQMYHCVNIEFDHIYCYYQDPDGGCPNYDVQLGKSTYKEIKDAVIAMYKKNGAKLEAKGYEVPDSCK